MIQKKAILILLCLLCTQSSSTEIYRRIITGNTILTSSLLRMIDGKNFGLHGQIIRKILSIRTCLVQMLQGKPQKNGPKKGLYTLKNKQYTVKQLYDIEKQNKIDHETLYNCLQEVKKDFAVQIDPFLDLGRGFKPQMLIFIKESLRLHQRENSILHLWAREAEGEDMIGFEKNVQSFGDLNQFLLDLLNFLDDLISSCPKARKQFIETLKTEHEKKIRMQQFAQVFERQKGKINALHQKTTRL